MTCFAASLRNALLTVIEFVFVWCSILLSAVVLAHRLTFGTFLRKPRLSSAAERPNVSRHARMAIHDGASRPHKASPFAPFVHRYRDSARLRARCSSQFVVPVPCTLYSVDRSTLRKFFLRSVRNANRPIAQTWATYLELGAESHHTHLVCSDDVLTRLLDRLIRSKLRHAVREE